MQKWILYDNLLYLSLKLVYDFLNGPFFLDLRLGAK